MANKAAVISSVTSSVVLGEACTIAWTPTSDSYYYSLYFDIGDKNVLWIESIAPENVPYSCTLAVSDFAKHIPNGTSATVTVRLVTIPSYGSTTQIGNSSSKTFTVTVPSDVLPTVTAVATINNSKNQTIADWGIAVSGYSGLNLTLTGEGAYGSTIVNYTITGAYTDLITSGDKVEYTGDIINLVGNRYVTVYVKDSRGRRSLGVKSNSIYFHQYSAPIINTLKISRVYSEATSTSLAQVQASWNYSAIGKNSCNVTLSYREKGATNWITYGGTIENNVATVLTGVEIAEETSYDFKLVVTDSLLNSAEYERRLSTDEVLLDFRAGGRGLGIGKMSEEDAMEVGMDSIFYQKIYIETTVGRVSLEEFIKSMFPFPGAGSHNSIYRGKNLGGSVTAEQFAAISDGTFTGLCLGDYWTINGVDYRIAAFDYYYMTGGGDIDEEDQRCLAHHIVVVPDSPMYTGLMNDTDTTATGYVGSLMYTSGLEQAKTEIYSAFGEEHILIHRQYLTNAVENHMPSGAGWYDSTVELMTEQNLYGSRTLGYISDGETIPFAQTIDKSQFPLFMMRPDLICNGQEFWVRDIVSDKAFCYASKDGSARVLNASNSALGIRPSFSIIG